MGSVEGPPTFPPTSPPGDTDAGARLRTNGSTLYTALDYSLTLAADADRHYRDADPTLRRQLNQAFFRRVYIRGTEAVGADLAEPYASLLHHELPAKLEILRPRETAPDGPGSSDAVLVGVAACCYLRIRSGIGRRSFPCLRLSVAIRRFQGASK